MKQYHNYHPETFEYSNSRPMKYSPLDNQPAPPANSTTLPLPILAANEAAVFDILNNKWKVVPDFRGITYYKKVDGSEVTFKLGQSPDNTVQTTLTAAVKLQNAKKAKEAELYQACGLFITSGFNSSALNANYTYPSTPQDQGNLNAVVTESMVNANNTSWQAPFWCVDGNGIWDRRLHNQAQIQQIGQDGATHVRGAQDKLKGLMDQLNDVLTDTEAKVAAIAW